MNNTIFVDMETNRQKKIAGVIQRDLVDILQGAARDGMKGVVISVTKVHVTTDLGQAKAYLSIFPSDKKDEIMETDIVTRTNLRCPECGFVERLDMPLNY